MRACTKYASVHNPPASRVGELGKEYDPPAPPVRVSGLKRIDMWYVYDISPRAKRQPILSGSARAVVDYAAGSASPIHRGDGFIYNPP